MMNKNDPIAQFYDAIRALNFAQTMDVANEVAAFLETEPDGVPAPNVAKALSDAAQDKPTNERPTRGRETS